jgi:hypothetical protein
MKTALIVGLALLSALIAGTNSLVAKTLEPTAQVNSKSSIPDVLGCGYYDDAAVLYTSQDMHECMAIVKFADEGRAFLTVRKGDRQLSLQGMSSNDLVQLWGKPEPANSQEYKTFDFVGVLALNENVKRAYLVDVNFVDDKPSSYRVRSTGITHPNWVLISIISGDEIASDLHASE